MNPETSTLQPVVIGVVLFPPLVGEMGFFPSSEKTPFLPFLPGEVPPLLPVCISPFLSLQDEPFFFFVQLTSAGA